MEAAKPVLEASAVVALMVAGAAVVVAGLVESVDVVAVLLPRRLEPGVAGLLVEAASVVAGLVAPPRPPKRELPVGPDVAPAVVVVVPVVAGVEVADAAGLPKEKPVDALPDPAPPNKLVEGAAVVVGADELASVVAGFAPNKLVVAG